MQPFQYFGVSRTFRSRLIGQHLSDVSRDLATLTFDLTEYPCDGLPSSHFGLPRPFRSRVMSRHATDRQTDRQMIRQPKAIYNAPLLRGRGHNNYTRTVFDRVSVLDHAVDNSQRFLDPLFLVEWEGITALHSPPSTPPKSD